MDERRGARAATGLAVLLCAAGMLAACQNGAPVAIGSSPVPSVGISASAQTGQPNPVPSGTAPTGTTTSGTGQPAECTKSSLTVSVAGAGAASGHRGVALVFTNTGTVACRMHGYPGVAALDAAGTQVAQARRTLNGYLGGLDSGQEPPTVVLAAGQQASALAEAVAFNPSDGSSCTGYRGLLVTAPDDTESTRLFWLSDGCADLQIHPVVPGADGRIG